MAEKAFNGAVPSLVTHDGVPLLVSRRSGVVNDVAVLTNPSMASWADWRLFYGRHALDRGGLVVFWGGAAQGRGR